MVTIRNACAETLRNLRWTRCGRKETILVALGIALLAGLCFDPGTATAGGSHGSAADLTRQLLARHAEWRQGDDRARAAGLKTLVGIAAARQERLAELIADRPDLVLRDALPEGTRAALPAPVQAYIETDETVDGDLEILHEDGPAGSRYHYFLNRASERVALHFAAAPPELTTGDRVRVSGLRVKQSMALASGRTAVVVLAAALPNTFGAQKTLVILVNFQDRPSQTWLTPAQAVSVVFGPGASSVSNFYLESSYQQSWLTGTAVGVFTIPVSSTTCDTTAIATQARQAATAAGANPSSYPRLVYAFPSVSACGWWGLGTVGGNPSQAWINGSFENGVVAHEMGHNFGLYHSHALECGNQTLGSACTSIEYGDTLDVMGSAVPPKHFNAPQKERLGWLNYGASPPVTTVQASGVYELDPFETVGSAPKALKVQTPSGDWYYVEYRQPLGFDASTVSGNSNVTNGVVVHLWSQQSANGIYLLDMTGGTDSWSDPALDVGNVFSDDAAGVTIAPVWVDQTAGVNVTVNGGPACVRNNPIVVVSPGLQRAAAGAMMTYTVSVTNNDSNCAASDFTAGGTPPTGWALAFPTPTLTIPAGVTGAMAMQVTSAASAPQGTYTLSPLVSNVTAPGYAGSGSASYQVKAASGTFTDNFNRANAATLGNGWTQAAGTLSIQSSQAASATTRATHMAVQASVTGGTQTVQARFQSANNQVNPRLGVVLRYTNSQNYYLCYREVGSVSRVAIARVSGGAEKLLKSASVTNPGKSKFFTVACQAQGATLTLFLDGTKKATVSDSAFASGSVGMSVSYATSASGSRKGGATSSGAAHRIDDFSATTQ